MKKLLFRRKTYGWGWTPVGWEGWGIITMYLLILLFISRRIPEPVATKTMIVQFFIPLIILTAILIFICYKTGEKPKWQWGNKKDM